MTNTIPKLSVRLPGIQRWLTYFALSLVALSGLLWYVLHDLFRFGWMITERRLLVTHGIAAAFSLVVIGGLLPLHIRLAWRIGRNLTSGIVSLSVMALLGLSGLMLYYSGEEWRDPVRWLHIGVGIVGIFALPAHIWLGRCRSAHRLRNGFSFQAETNSERRSTIIAGVDNHSNTAS